MHEAVEPKEWARKEDPEMLPAWRMTEQTTELWKILQERANAIFSVGDERGKSDKSSFLGASYNSHKASSRRI